MIREMYRKYLNWRVKSLTAYVSKLEGLCNQALNDVTLRGTDVAFDCSLVLSEKQKRLEGLDYRLYQLNSQSLAA